MNDLLGNIKGGSGHVSTRNNVDIEMGPEQTDQSQLQEFLKTIDTIKVDLENLKAAQRDIVAMHERTKAMTRPSELQDARAELQAMIASASGMAHKIKAKLEGLERSNAQARRLKGQGQGSAQDRTRTALTAGQRQKFSDQIGEFGKLRGKIQDEYRDQIKQRMYTVSGLQPDDDQVDKVIDSGEADNIFRKAVQIDQARGMAQSTLAEVQERNKAWEKLLQSLGELNQITVDLALHVEQQGEQLDRISEQVAKGAVHVERAAEQIQDAKNYQRGSRKCMCWAALILAIIIIIVLIAVLLTIKPWNIN